MIAAIGIVPVAANTWSKAIRVVESRLYPFVKRRDPIFGIRIVRQLITKRVVGIGAKRRNVIGDILKGRNRRALAVV